MNERDIHRAEGAILSGLTILTSQGMMPVIVLVVLVHAVAFGAYGIHAAFSQPMGPAVFGALAGLCVVLMLRWVIGFAKPPRRVLRWITAAMLLCVLVPFEAATGLSGRAAVAVTGLNPDIGIFRLTGLPLGPEAMKAKEFSDEKARCLAAKADGTLALGNNRSVSFAWSCQAYYLPEDGERACNAFAASKRTFNWKDHRAFCSTWVKGAALQPHVMRLIGEYE